MLCGLNKPNVYKLLSINGKNFVCKYQKSKVHLFHHYHECTMRSFGGRGLRPGVRFLEYKKWRPIYNFWSVNWQFHARMRGSSPQCVLSHLPNIATLRRGTTHFSTCTDVVWSWRPRLPALNEVLSPVLPLTAWVPACFSKGTFPYSPPTRTLKINSIRQNPNTGQTDAVTDGRTSHVTTIPVEPIWAEG
jgi:hypothetical protein